MQAVMISSSPLDCELIADGKKTIIVKKTTPKLKPTFKCYIYRTKDQKSFYIDEEEWFPNLKKLGKVIGEFVCDKLSEWNYYENEDGLGCDITPNELNSTYLFGNDLIEYGQEKTLYGWHISQLKIYDKPKELSEFDYLCKYPKNDCEQCAKQNLKPHCNYGTNLTRPPRSWCYVEVEE